MQLVYAALAYTGCRKEHTGMQVVWMPQVRKGWYTAR
jgi:hypothetical protein